MHIYRHHTAVEVIDFDDQSGRWVPLEEDDENPIMVGQMAMIQRAHFSVRGSYTIEDDKRCYFYWTDHRELVFRGDNQRFVLFRYDTPGSLTDLEPTLQATLEPATYGDGRAIPDVSTFSLTDGNGRSLFRISYNSQRYLQSYLGNFTFVPDEDLSDWDFFVHVKRTIDELRILSRSIKPNTNNGQRAPAAGEHVVTAKTGDKAARAGLWVPLTVLDIRCKLDKGDAVSDLEGKDATWIWVGP